MAKVTSFLKSPKFLTAEIIVLLILLLFLISNYLRPKEIQKLKTQINAALTQNDLSNGYRLVNQTLLLSPNDPALHLTLAQIYQKTNNWDKAAQELQLAAQLDPNNKQLLINLQNTENILNEPRKIQEQVSFWEKEVKSKPDYRDGWLQLAKGYYQLYQTDKAKLSLNHAWQIDPNYQPTKDFLEIVK